MALLWGCAVSSLSAEVERTTSGLTQLVIEESGGYFLGAGVRWGSLSGVEWGSFCAGFGGVTRGPLPFLTTVLPPIFIGIAFLLSDAMFGERIVMDDSLYHIS